MNLTLFFRLIVTSVFQKSVVEGKTNRHGDDMRYDSTRFYCPVVYAKDGFNISLQIQNGNYCKSERGYRELGHTWLEVEFGFPSEDDSLLHQHTEGYGYTSEEDDDNKVSFDPSSFSSVGRVGRIPVSVLEELFERRGGIDWDKTISVEQFDRLVGGF